jgi:flagellar biosynthesis protein FliQ
MKLSLTLLSLIVALVYGVIVNFFPGFPIDEETLLSLAVFVLALLGVEISEPLIRRGLVKLGLRGFLK